uniref:PNK FHA domain-containing protein n=1 Tax=Denticeps clupeoides TaxID=299321 RepID=A0AAY4AM08_9TELE
MPGFELVPVDGGSLVQLPVGETVVGRGPLFGVNDKRVSRHHGLLENMAGQLRIKPTHLNPCFIQTSAVAPPQPLEKERWHVLRPGDIFSLLPGKYIYKVAVSRNCSHYSATCDENNDALQAQSKSSSVLNLQQIHNLFDPNNDFSSAVTECCPENLHQFFIAECL